VTCARRLDLQLLTGPHPGASVGSPGQPLSAGRDRWFADSSLGKRDSNSRSRSQIGASGERQRGQALWNMPHRGGTESSNPVSSSGESVANLTFGAHPSMTVGIP
jgi:hypothetical protein